MTPAIINATTVPGQVDWRIPFYAECRATATKAVTSHSTVRIYSPEGLVESHRIFVPHPLPTETSVKLRLPGPGPWLVAGDGPPCADWATTALEGVTDGFTLLSLRDKELWIRQKFEVTVPIGETQGETAWDPSDYTWWLIQSFVGSGDREARRGERYGNMTLHDAEGNLSRWDHFTMFGFDFGWPQWGGLVPGEYKMRLQLEQPALLPTTWTYTIDHFEITSDVCLYGFRFPDLC